MTRHELLAQSSAAPVPTSLAELDPAEDVWPPHVEFGAVAHRSTDRLTAVCGARILRYPVPAGQMAALFGRLCGRCWPSTEETPAGTGR